MNDNNPTEYPDPYRFQYITLSNYKSLLNKIPRNPDDQPMIAKWISDPQNELLVFQIQSQFAKFSEEFATGKLPDPKGKPEMLEIEFLVKMLLQVRNILNAIDFNPALKEVEISKTFIEQREFSVLAKTVIALQLSIKARLEEKKGKVSQFDHRVSE